jgi:hypothetical protein
LNIFLWFVLTEIIEIAERKGLESAVDRMSLKEAYTRNLNGTVPM